MKHPYANNLHERHAILLYVAGLAFAAAIGLGHTFQWVGWTPPSWLDVPSAGGFYGIGYAILRHYGWRWAWLRSLGLIRTPILDGAWSGEVQTSFDAHSKRHSITVEIDQDWTHILIRLKSQYSTSRSLIAALTVDGETILSYEYYNEPSADAVATMHAHRGTAVLKLSSDAQRLSGEYYSGRDRREIGLLELRRRTD